MPNITKQGIMNSNSFNESIGCKYDLNVYEEPDGSAWVCIFHHNNPNGSLFASTDTFDSSVYLDADRWFNVSILEKISNSIYELMIKQLPASGGTLEKYRWIQYSNPMTCAFGDVDAADVSINSSSGYTTISGYGGIYLKKSSTYLCVNNSASGNWMGAIGSWSAWNSGIPGWGKAVTTGYLDLFIRIDNQTNSIMSIFDTHMQSREFIEW